LSALSITGSSMTSMAPGFAPGTRLYEVVSFDSSTGALTATPAANTATVVVTVRSATIPRTAGVATVPLIRGRNDITVTVTSFDQSSTTVYTVVVWRHVAPTPGIVSLPPIKTLPYGGQRFDVRLSDGALPPDCNRQYRLRREQAEEKGAGTFDPVTGLTDAVGMTPALGDQTPGKADLTIVTNCNPPGGGLTSTVTAPNAVTVLDKVTVTRSEIPATVSVASVFRVYGPGISYDSDMAAWLEDADGTRYALTSWDWTGPDQSLWYLDYYYEEHFFMKARKLTFNFGHYDPDNKGLDGAISDFARTVGFVPPAPTIVSVSPASGPLAGGSTFRIRGRYLYSYTEYLTVKVGDEEADFSTEDSAYGSDDFATYMTGLDTLEVTVPEGVAPGLVPVHVSTEYGEVVAATKFRYSARPQIDSISPSSVAQTGGSLITLTGSGFGTAGTPTVVVGGVKSPLVTRASATQLTAVVPASGTTGPVAVTVSSPQGGGVSAPAELTVTATGTLPTISKVSPAIATGGDPVTITGTNFGPAGTVAVGVGGTWAVPTSATATSLTFTVPTASTAGLQNVSVGTPTGLAAASSGLRVLPAAGITAVSPVAVASYATGVAAQIVLTGAGFGSTGTVQVGGAPQLPYTATLAGTRISGVAVPTAKAGSLPVVVTPKGAKAPLRTTVRVSGPSIDYIGSNPYAIQYDANNINDNPTGDMILQVETTGGSPARIQGTGFGTSGVLLVGGKAVATKSWTDTAITFLAPAHAVGPVAVSVTPARSALSATRAVGINYIPVIANLPTIVRIASVVDQSYPDRTDFDSVADTSAAFTLTPTAVTATSLNFDAPRTFSTTGGLWGGKTFVVTPSDNGVPARSVAFTCAVTPTVTTTANASANPLTVPAGAAFTMGSTSTGFVGPVTVTAPGGYEYVIDADHGSTGFSENVHAGVPSAAGDYWVRVALQRATYDRAPYLPFTVAPVHIIIEGLPVTVSAVSDNGSSFVYRGQLMAGTTEDPADFHYTATATTDPITKVYYEHRDTVCVGQGAGAGWADGLPGNVATSDPGCSGDGTTHSTWQVRVKSFEMTSGGTDRAGYYLATLPIVTIDITAKSLTVDSVRADKIWDGTDTAPLGELTVTGAVDGDDVQLAEDSTGTFANADVEVDKPVTLADGLVLGGAAAGNYALTNPNPTILGTISKATARLALSAAPTTVLMSLLTPSTITSTVTDTVTGNPPDNSAGIAPVVLVSQTPPVCSITGVTVLPVGAGTCVIAGTEAASANYEAATATSDPASTTETVEIQVFAAPQTISVIADDRTVAEGDNIDPTVQISGLFDGDSISGFDYDYYSGNTLLMSAPTAVGTYKIVPKGGTLTATTTLVYNNPTEFTYVPGTLVITPVPPSVAVIEPRTGPVTGGNTVTVTGTRLDTVDTIKIGTSTLSGGSFTVESDGTQLTFAAPAVRRPGPVDLILTAGSATTTDVYTYFAVVPWAPRSVQLAAASTSFSLSFTVPASDGGAEITAYQITLNGGKTWITRSPSVCQNGACTLALTGLIEGTTYPVNVRAVNEVGPGPWSPGQSAVTNAPWRPSLPEPPNQVPVPANPDAYRGPRRFTEALFTTFGGRPAAPISSLGRHQMVRGDAVTTLRGELFAFDSAELTAAGRAAVRTVAQHLRLAHRVTCEGYTDYAGEPAHEKALSAARAKIICQTLIAYGADVTVTSVGYGGARPVVVGGTPQSRAENRRVVIRVDS